MREVYEAVYVLSTPSNKIETVYAIVIEKLKNHPVPATAGGETGSSFRLF